MKTTRDRPSGRRRASVSRSSIAERLFASTRPPGPLPAGTGPDCLSADTFVRLARGDRSMEGVDRIEAHLATCDHCCDALASAVDASKVRYPRPSRAVVIEIALAPLLDRSVQEPLRLAASSEQAFRPRWLSHENGDVRVIVHERGGDLLAVVERAGRPVRGAAVRLDGGDEADRRNLDQSKQTNARGEVSLGSRDRIGAVSPEIRLQLELPAADARPPGARARRQVRGPGRTND